MMLPRRKYQKGTKKMVSFRLPTKLIEEIKKISKQKKYTVSDVVNTFLDVGCQQNQDK